MGDGEAPEQGRAFVEAATEAPEIAEETVVTPAPIETEGAEPEIKPPIPPLPWIRLLPGAVGMGLVFAFVGFLFGLRTIAVATLPHILVPGDYIDFQEVTDGHPVPRLLDWNLSLIHGLLTLSDMNMGLRILLGTFLIGLLWLLAIAVLNETFRPLRIYRVAPSVPAPAVFPTPSSETPESTDGQISAGEAEPIPVTSPPPSRAPLHIFLEIPQLSKAFSLLLMVGLPLALIWMLADQLGGGFAVGDDIDLTPALSGWDRDWLARFLALGIALWIGYHRDGLASDFNEPEYRPRLRRLPFLILCGGLFGISVYLLLRWILPGPLEGLLLRYQMLGTFNRASWRFISGRYLFSAGAVWFASGALLTLLGRARIEGIRRLALLALPAVAALAALTAQRPFLPQALASRFDITPQTQRAIRAPYSPKQAATGVPDGVAAGAELSRRAHIPRGQQPAQPDRNVLFFYPDATIVTRQLGITEDGLSTAKETEQPVRDFLTRRDYQSALSWVAIKHLYNVGTVHFDNTLALESCLLDMEHAPHQAQIGPTARAMFFTCAASPPNLALLDRLADPRHFAFNDRDSLRMMGDLYRRFGVVDQALHWYEKAEMPKSFLARIRSEKPLFHQGRIAGILRWNGRPLAGVQVGALPQRLNGLPPDLEPVLLHTGNELVPRYPFPPFFPPLHPRPYAFRWITAGATTDANGAFTLENLTEGEYVFVCTLPPDVKANLGIDRALRITNKPAPLTLNYEHPDANLGTVELAYTP